MINSVTLHGNLSTAVYPSQKGNSARFQIAYNRYLTLEGESVEKTDYVWVTVAGRLAQNSLKYLSKGDPVTVQGHLTGGSYLDKDGNWQNNLCIFAESAQFHHRRSRQDDNGSSLPPLPQQDVGITEIHF
jgi:single-strand DNA-binding protein